MPSSLAFFHYIGHLVKKAWQGGVAHGDTVCQSSEHGKVIVAVAEGIGVLFVYLVIIKHIVKTGGFGVAERNEFAEIAAPVNALKIAVTCGTETGKAARGAQTIGQTYHRKN